MTTRREQEQAISEEENALEQVASLLETRAPVVAWPPPLRNALALALVGENISRTEQWKATALRRHLFGEATPVPPDLQTPATPDSADVRCAERLRAGLCALVRFRAATYLSATSSSYVRRPT
jgi:hypothetical protein